MFPLRANPLPHQCVVARCRKPRQKWQRYCHRHQKALWRQTHPIISAWRGIIDRARRKGREFSLTTADFIDFLEETAYMDSKGRWRHCTHMDRKDNTRGYVRGNIQALTCTQNTIKGNKERCPF